MKITKIFLLAAAMTLAASPVHAADSSPGFHAGDIMVRGRVLTVRPSVDSSVSTIGGQVNASASFEPEADVTYFFTPTIAVEAIAAVTRHHLTDRHSSLGNVDLGHVSLLPPTVTAQYHFLPTERFNPYLGAGINYTVFFDHDLPAGGVARKIHYDNEFGAAIQAGADFQVQGNWYVNVDVKHIFLTTHAKINGTIGANVSLDPTIVGVGIGYKF